MTIALKPNVFVTMEMVKAHLNIKPEQKDFDDRLSLLINMSCDKIEKYIQGPVMVQERTDIQDGTASNVLVPHFYPVRKVNEVRIDYNGDFSSSPTIIDPTQYGLRGYMRSLEFGMAGSDIYVRNDGNISIIGRLFIGSVVQSIRVKYDAGLAYSKEDLPGDLLYAALMLIEYFYTLRENRELGVKSKTNLGGQQYTRETGIPKEITDMLDPYVDYTFGAANRPQKNEFAV